MVASRWLADAWFPNIVAGFFRFVPRLFAALQLATRKRKCEGPAIFRASATLHPKNKQGLRGGIFKPFQMQSQIEGILLERGLQLSISQ